jgi:hypothetical protein
MIHEIKTTKNNRIIEWIRFGGFHRFYSKMGKAILRFHPDSLTSLHGISLRTDQRCFGEKGRCTTKYSRGRFVFQEFRYKNRRLAYRFGHSKKSVVVKYPDGKIAWIVECPGKGFSTRSGDTSGGQWFPDRREEDVHSCSLGLAYFDVRRPSFKKLASEGRGLDFSKDGNCLFRFFDRRGRLSFKGEFRNRQRSGEWVISGKSRFYLQGVMVDKKIWSTKPEDLKVYQALRVKNAQLRAALLAKIGAERIAKECKHKVIHQTKNGMKLMEFPIKVDDGDGGIKSHLRILMVTCPSTGNKYYLNVPDFVWDGSKKTKLDKCETARQWTFGINHPKDKIKFAVET